MSILVSRHPRHQGDGRFSGITSERVKIIAGEWNRIKADKETIFFLNSIGCTPRQRVLIMEAYKEKTVELVKENPYRMIRDIPGFGFKTVDGFAKQLGVANDSPLRAEAALEHILKSSNIIISCYAPWFRFLKYGERISCYNRSQIMIFRRQSTDYRKKRLQIHYCEGRNSGNLYGITFK